MSLQKFADRLLGGDSQLSVEKEASPGFSRPGSGVAVEEIDKPPVDATHTQPVDLPSRFSPPSLAAPGAGAASEGGEKRDGRSAGWV